MDEENLVKPEEKKVEKSFSVVYYEDNTIDFTSETLTPEEISEMIEKLAEEIKTQKLTEAVIRACVRASFNGANSGAKEAIEGIARMKQEMENNGNNQ